MYITLADMRLKVTPIGAYYRYGGEIVKIDLLHLPHIVLAQMPANKRPIYVSVYLYLIGRGVWVPPIDICNGMGLAYQSVKTALEKLTSFGVVDRDMVASNYSYYIARGNNDLSENS